MFTSTPESRQVRELRNHWLNAARRLHETARQNPSRRDHPVLIAVRNGWVTLARKLHRLAMH